MKRGLGRRALAVLAGVLVAAGGVGRAEAGLLTHGALAENPQQAISHGSAGLTGSREAVRVLATPLAPLGVFQTDTSRTLESAWVGLELSANAGPGVSHLALPASLGLAALAAERNKALAAGVTAAPPDNTTGRPTDDFSYLGLGPKMFALLRSGKPSGGLEQWSHSNETSLSYVQPHRQLQFVVKFFGEGHPEPGESMSAAPIQNEEQLVDNQHVDLDTSDMGGRSQEYGRIGAKSEHKEPPSGRMVAVGLELGLLPAVVGNVALNSELIIGRSSNPGFYVGLATSVALPVERGSSKGAPDVPFRTPYDVSGGGSSWGGMSFSDGGLGGGAGVTGTGGGGGGGGNTPFTPLIPITPTPEPGTLMLMALGSAWLVARRRAGK